jgi:hypothetical protein
MRDCDPLSRRRTCSGLATYLGDPIAVHREGLLAGAVDNGATSNDGVVHLALSPLGFAGVKRITSRHGSCPIVMAWLHPRLCGLQQGKPWMAGPSPSMTVGCYHCAS